MKIPVFTLTLFLIASLTLNGCKKTELTGELAVYEGTWESINAALELKDNGRATHVELLGNSRRSINGRLIITESRLRITAVFASRNFNIDLPPSERADENGDPEMFMRLDGVDYVRR